MSASCSTSQSLRGPRRVRRNPDESWRAVANDLQEAHELIGLLLRSERRAWARAHSLSDATRELLSLLNHELRNPIQAIFGYTELLEAGIHGKLNEDQLTDVSRIQESQKELLETLEAVLTRVKMERLPPPENQF
jgi:signal transduction histidine kinase